MKRLVVALMVMSSLVFAKNECEHLDKVAQRIQKHNVSTVYLNYTTAQKTAADSCQTKLQAMLPNLTIKMNPVTSGKDSPYFSKTPG